MIRASNGIVIDHRKVQERFVHAMGPGGRNLHAEALAVELRLDLKPLSLPPEVLDRLILLAGKNVTNDGVLVVVSRMHRSQALNREAARERLADLLDRAFATPKKRKSTRPRKRVREDRLASKKRRSAVKQARGRGGKSED
jgi:ribosome-associated protein